MRVDVVNSRVGLLLAVTLSLAATGITGCAGQSVRRTGSVDVPPTDVAQDVAALRELSEQIFAAIQRKDAAFFARLLADDFEFYTPSGDTLNKQTFIAGIAGADYDIVDIGAEFLNVHVRGDAALVTGVQRAVVRLGAETVVDRGAFSDLFVRRGGTWQLAVSYTVSLPKPSS